MSIISGYPEDIPKPEISIELIEGEVDVRIPFEITCQVPGVKEDDISYTIKWYISNQMIHQSNLDDNDVAEIIDILPLEKLQEVKLFSVSHNIIDSLAPGYAAVILNYSFETHIKDRYLEHFLWNCSQVYARRTHHD